MGAHDGERRLAGRAGLSAVVHRGELYVLGGSRNDDAAIIGGPPTVTVWRVGDGLDAVKPVPLRELKRAIDREGRA